MNLYAPLDFNVVTNKDFCYPQKRDIHSLYCSFFFLFFFSPLECVYFIPSNPLLHWQNEA